MNFLKTNSKTALISAFAVAGIIVFIGWDLLTGLATSSVKVLDARVTFKFTAYRDKDQYFVSYSLENKKTGRVRAFVRVQLGDAALGGHLLHVIKAENDSAVLEPLETRSFVTKIEIPKTPGGAERDRVARVKVKRVSGA